MLLFSGKLKLHFQTLAQGNMRHLKLAATWAQSEWGYIRNKGVPFRMKVLEDMKDQVYIETIDPLQVGKKTSEIWIQKSHAKNY